MSSLTARRQRSECVVAQKASPTTKKAQLPSLSFATRFSSSSISTSQKSLSASINFTPKKWARSLLLVLMTEVQYSRYTSLHDLMALSALTDMSSGSPSPNPMMQNTIVDYYKQRQLKPRYQCIIQLFFLFRTNSFKQDSSLSAGQFYNKIFRMNHDGKKDEDRIDIIDDGFSSEEELLPEEIAIITPKRQEIQASHKQQVRFKIPPPQQIKDRPYQLRPDLQTGWQSHLTLPIPIPIIFESERFDQLIRRILKHPKPKVKLCYLGPRFENTYYAWYDKCFTFPYNHVKPPNDMKFTNRPFCGQHWQAEDELVFDSFFEGGNLDCVMRVGERQYDCFMRVDSNTAGHLQWFNFKVKGWKKLLKYKINICNFQKDKCLFSRGMKPYMYSEKRFNQQKIGWKQDGEVVKFEKRQITAAKIYELEMRSAYRLSFEYYTHYDDDQVQMAYCIPYTYSRLGEFLKQLTVKPENKTYLKISKLCHSLGGLEVPLIIVHQGLDEQKFQVEEQIGIKKKCIIISGRAHPGESNGSHMMQGFIEWLCSDSKNAQTLRKYIVFKIVPMLNPDGVALGNYRTGLSGKDFNREYKCPDKSLFPQVYHFKKLVSENKLLFGDKLVMFLDFHGHSTKKNTFVYGPEFPIVDRFYYEARLFPKLISNTTSMFRYYSCSFKINELKETTARAVMLRRLNIPLSYTIETSNGCYFDYQLMKDVPYTQIKWREMGYKVGLGLFEYIDITLMADRNRIDKVKAKVKNKQKETKKSQSQSKKISPLKSSSPIKIFSNMQNEKIKHLLSEIKQAEENKQHEKISDDQMSQGSSDLQDEENDLSPTQTNFLMRVIKGGKCRSVSKCRMRRIRADKQQYTAQQNPTTSVNIQQAEKEEPQKETDVNSKEEILAPKVNFRKPVSKDHIANIQTKRGTARIVNFSFCSQPPQGRRQSQDRSQAICLPSKLNFLELVTGKWAQEKARRASNVSNASGPSVSKTKGALDLSDLHFRKTFTHNFHTSDIQPQYVLSKRGMFDSYKYRRLLIGEDELSLI